MLNRSLTQYIRASLGPKITLITGPRQVGKTTLAKMLDGDFAYYNYDVSKDFRIFSNGEWDRDPALVIFDELHKKKKWKLWLKGLYDSGRFDSQSAVVTGSARLNHIKKVGDSLAGRFREFRLHPLDLKELKLAQVGKSRTNYESLLERGGFPEPFFETSSAKSRTWRRSHTDTILRQDLLSLEIVRDLDSIEVMLELIAERVGSLISYNSLAGDLGVSDLTVKRWLGLLEDLYVVFRVSAASKTVTRGLSKAAKYYFYDLGRVTADEGAKFENLVALSFRKELDFLEDVHGYRTKLGFLRNKEKKEIDFLVQIEGQKPKLIEVKLTDDVASKNFAAFDPYYPKCKKIQLVANLTKRFDTSSGVSVENGITYLENLDWQC